MKKRHIANCPVSSSWWEFTKCIHLQVQWRFFIFFVHLILIIREVIYKILIIREVFHPILMMQGGPAVLRPVLQRAVCSALCKMPRLHHIGDFHNQYCHRCHQNQHCLHLHQHQHCHHHHQQKLINLYHDNQGLHSCNGPVLASRTFCLLWLPCTGEIKQWGKKRKVYERSGQDQHVLHLFTLVALVTFDHILQMGTLTGNFAQVIHKLGATQI